MTKQNVGILIFDDVEVLDFAGPFEVFSRTRLEPGVGSRRSEVSAPFNVYTVAQTEETVTAIVDCRLFRVTDFPVFRASTFSWSPEGLVHVA